MNKGIKNPVSASEQAIVLFIDATLPLILEAQLFWFDEIISQFLREKKVFQTSNGIQITSLSGFKYTPLKMEPTKRSPYAGYLSGFESNMHKECYTKISVPFASEDEKLRHVKLLKTAAYELVRAAASSPGTYNGPWFEWEIDEKK